MSEPFDIQAYMTQGIETLVADALKAALKNPRESAFLLRFAAASRVASRKRRRAEEKGEHVPPFLIASFTSSCNLHCAGCYSRCNHATVDSEPVSQLTAASFAENVLHLKVWARCFRENTPSYRMIASSGFIRIREGRDFFYFQKAGAQADACVPGP